MGYKLTRAIDQAMGGPEEVRFFAGTNVSDREDDWRKNFRCPDVAVFLPGNPVPVVMPHDTPELQLVQRVRDEAHRFAITHHRIRRDKAMTESIMDELPGIGPNRKRALLRHFGSPEAVLGATREQLEAVPGMPAKVGRDLYHHLNKTGR